MSTPTAPLFFLFLMLSTILGMPPVAASKIAPLQSCVRPCPSETNLRLYLHQFFAGPDHPNRNEEFVVSPTNPFATGFGTTLVHGWAITRTTNPNGTIIAYMQGTHIQAGTATTNSWYISSSIVFESGSFSGSTLQVMGTIKDNIVNQWSIVGGTGEFEMAHGIINYENDKASNKDDGIKELNIRIIYDANSRIIAQ